MIDERILGRKLDEIIYICLNALCFCGAAFFTSVVLLGGSNNTINGNVAVTFLLMGTLISAGMLITSYIVRWEMIRLIIINEAHEVGLV